MSEVCSVLSVLSGSGIDMAVRTVDHRASVFVMYEGFRCQTQLCLQKPCFHSSHREGWDSQHDVFVRLSSCLASIRALIRVYL